MLEYTYPDGSGMGGTFTDGDDFSQETVQSIIDNVVATTQADTEARIIKRLEGQDAEVWFGMNLTAVAVIKGENK